MKETIRQAVDRVKSGKGTNEDKAIMHLLEQCRDLKVQLQNFQKHGVTNVPLHQDTPWYMQ